MDNDEPSLCKVMDLAKLGNFAAAVVELDVYIDYVVNTYPELYTPAISDSLGNLRAALKDMAAN